MVDYEAMPFDGVALHDVEFLSRPDIPRQAVTTLVGPKRSFKSTYALWKAAALSRRHRVLIVEREDPKFVVKARLMAMGADLGNVRFFRKTVIRHDEKVTLDAFDFHDLDGIITVAERFRADLVIIDPVTALAKGKWNDQSSADCLVDLTALAQRNNCAVLAIMHTNQNPDDVDTGASGSDQWVAKCRSHLLIDKLPGDDSHAIVQQVSNSYGSTQNYEITAATKQLTDDGGKQFDVCMISDVRPTTQSVEDLYRLKRGMKAEAVDPDQQSEIIRWEYDTIRAKGGHVFATDLQDWAKAKGYTPNQLRLAYREAGIGQTRQGCKRPRSILYAKDMCGEQEAKDWGTPESADDEESRKGIKSKSLGSLRRENGSRAESVNESLGSVGPEASQDFLSFSKTSQPQTVENTKTSKTLDLRESLEEKDENESDAPSLDAILDQDPYAGAPSPSTEPPDVEYDSTDERRRR